MTNLERCSSSPQHLLSTFQSMAKFGPDAVERIDWERWLASDVEEPTFKKAMPGRYTPTRSGSRWYKCLILDDRLSLFGKPAALIWTLAGDHVAIVILKEFIRYE